MDVFHASVLQKPVAGLQRSAASDQSSGISPGLFWTGRDCARNVFHRLARKIALVFLLTVDLAGAAVLSFFGISLSVVQVAGGLVVAAMGWRLLNEQEAGSREGVSAAATGHRSLDEKVFYPFSFPITAGPGTLVVTLTLRAHATQKTFFATAWAHLGIMAGVVLLYRRLLQLCLRACAHGKISRQTIHGVVRVIAFILLCIGAQIAWNGLQPLLRTMLH
jgi:multiple antibiotic resistance protein